MWCAHHSAPAVRIPDSSTHCWRPTRPGVPRSRPPTTYAPNKRRPARRSARPPRRIGPRCWSGPRSSPLLSRPPRPNRPMPKRPSAQRIWPSRTSSSTVFRPAAKTTSWCSTPSVEPRAIDDPKDHVELGESLGLFDLERGAKVSGARFFFLTGHGALLQLGLMQLAVRLATESGFTLVIPPVLVRPEIMEGTGFLGAHSEEVYRLEADDLYLVGTSEVPLAGYHSDEILDLSAGPLRYAGWSSCFRREAGSHGKDTRGIIRVHQFDKVEGFVYCQTGRGRGRTRAAAGLGAPDAGQYRCAVPRDRHRGGRPRFLGRAQVRLRGLDTDPADLPGADLDVELHDVSGPSARDSLPRRERQTADGGDAERDAGHHPVVGRDPGEPPAARRQRVGCPRRWCRSWEPRCWNLANGSSSSSSIARNSLGAAE